MTESNGKKPTTIREAMAESMYRELAKRPRGLQVGSLMLYLHRHSGWTRTIAERAVDDLVKSGRAYLDMRGTAAYAIAVRSEGWEQE